MALATQCPHCSTIFKVASDQLKLRAGLVRCGICKEVFNGADCLVAGQNLEPPAAGSSGTPAPDDHPAAKPPPATAVTPVPGEPASPATGPSAPAHGEAEPAPATAGEPVPQTAVNSVSPDAEPDLAAWLNRAAGKTPQPPAGDRMTDPMLRMTLLDIAQAGKPLLERASPPEPGTKDDNTDGGPTPAAASAVPAGVQADAAERGTESADAADDALAARIDELTSRPVSGSRAWPQNDDEDRAIDPDLPEPSFLAQARRRPQRVRMMRIGTVLLLLLLIVQSTYLMRNRLVAALPQTGSFVAAFCRLAGCSVGLPTDIESVLIEASELQQAVGSATLFNLSFTLRNKATTAQAWPHVELTLNDSSDKPVVRRVFTPEDYVGSQQLRKSGIAPRNEEAFRLRFELANVKASGYRLYLFYP